jgi:RNA recognition motif-containing protein
MAMSRRVFVGNLGATMTAAELSVLFRPYGTVQSVHVVKVEDTTTAGGYGYVEMHSPQEAQSAVAALNGRKVTRRCLTVVQVPLMSCQLFSPTLHQLLAHIRQLAQRIEEHVQFMCGIADFKGTSLEEKERAVEQFHQHLLRLEEKLARLKDGLQTV